MVRSALSRVGRAMTLAQRGAGKAYSDYGLDYAQGFDLMLPHLAQSRNLARLMQADAMVRLHDGDSSGAAERIATIYRMGEHSGHDDVLISSLVGQAIWTAGDSALQTMLDRGQLSAADAATVLAAANDIPADDPYRYVEAMMMEQELSLSTVQRLVDGDEGIGALAGLMGEGAELPGDLLNMTREELHGDLEQYGMMMNDIVAAFASSDPELGRAELDRIEQELLAGEHGALAQILTPAFSNVLARKLDGERQLAERVEMLRKIAAGEIDAIEQANAAVWYLRAVELLHGKEAGTLALLRATPEDGAADRSTLDAFLDESADVLATLEQASVMKRCDFAIARKDLPAVVLAPAYATGLRDLMRFVEAETARRMRAGDGAAVLERLRLAWSMLGHFQTDPMYTTAITTHDAFNRAVETTMAAHRATLIDDAGREELHSLAGRLGRADPFAYVASLVAAREGLTNLFYARIPWDSEEREKLHQQLRATISQFPGELLLHIAASLDTMRHSSRDDYGAYKKSFAPLDDVFDLAALDRARGDVPRVAPVLAGQDLEPAKTWQVVDFASIRSRMSQARQDLRRGLATLQPPASAATATRGDQPGDPEQGE